MEGNTANHDQNYVQALPMDQRQGWLWLTEDSEVSGAAIGVLCGRMDGTGMHPDYYGGVVRAMASTFRNCGTGAMIMRYERRNTSGAELDNLSRFTNCSFLTDAAWHDLYAAGPGFQVHLDDVHGIRLDNCSFRNLDPETFQPGGQGWGIYSFFAGFHVLGNSTPATAFQNMGVGIVAFSGATETYSVDRMTFENNMAGIYDMMGIAPRITRNVFHVPDQGDLPRAPLGLLLNQSTAYVVEENQFIGNTGTSSVGIGFLGEQMANNQIYNNEFTHLTVGTMVAGRHKGNVPGHEYDGLQILCGDYLANTTDLGLWMFSYIRQDQGQVHTTNVTQSQLAGNRWLDPAIPNTSWDIAILVDPAQGSPENPPLPHINYFRHADEVCDPISPSDYYSDISVPEAGAFNKSTSCGMGDLQPPPGPPGEVRSTYLARAAQFESAAKQYRGTVNNGMKEEELIKAIGKNDPPYTSFALRDLILSASPVTDPVMFLKQLVLPALSLGLVQAAVLTRYVRSAILDVMREDYIRTARAKGLLPMRALWRHGMRNASVPVVTVLALQLATLLIGAVVVERVFVIPGLGSLLLDSVANRDLIVVQDVVMLLVLAVLLVNMLVDVLYVAIDPRMRAGGAR